MRIMKKLLFVLATSVALVACNDECDHNIGTIDPTAPEIVGNWYNEGANEEDRYSPSGTFYMKYSNLIGADEIEGRYEFDSETNRLTWNYNGATGANMFDDWKVTELSDYTLTIKSAEKGTFEYGRILETVKFEEYGKSDTVAYLDMDVNYPELSVRSYSSTNERIATVDDDGRVVAKGEKGTAYIKINTTIGDVWSKVVVGDDCADMWFDYPSALDVNFSQLKQTLGVPDLQGNDGYSFGYSVGTTHHLLEEVDVFLDETTSLSDQIILSLKTSVPTYQVDAYLKSHYYHYPTQGEDFYITGPDPASCKALVWYAKEYNAVVFYSVQDLLREANKGNDKDKVEHLWTDYTQDFKKTPSQLKAAYGRPFYEDEETLYFYQYDEWMDMVAFTLDPNTSETYSISAFLNSTCDWNTALGFLDQKYYYYEAGSDESANWYAFTNKSTLDESNIGITFDGEYGCITYVDLTYNYTRTRSFSEKKAFCFNKESLEIKRLR